MWVEWLDFISLGYLGRKSVRIFVGLTRFLGIWQGVGREGNRISEKSDMLWARSLREFPENSDKISRVISRISWWFPFSISAEPGQEFKTFNKTCKALILGTFPYDLGALPGFRERPRHGYSGEPRHSPCAPEAEGHERRTAVAR